MNTPPDPPERTTNWCGRDKCPHCQGYEYGPSDMDPCPWLGQPLPSTLDMEDVAAIEEGLIDAKKQIGEIRSELGDAGDLTEERDIALRSLATDLEAMRRKYCWGANRLVEPGDN